MSTPKPSALGLAPSFGFGDRLGLATPGHLAALREAGGPIRGIFAQQSIREMTRTKRTPTQVMVAAAEALAAAAYGEPWGADADHLKTEQDVQSTADAGFVFYTIDPSDHVDGQVDRYDEAALAARFEAVRDDVPWVDQYVGKTIGVDGGPTIRFDRTAVHRAAVKYGRAIARALELGRTILEESRRRKLDAEIELSVDETPAPTTLAEHYIIADQCRQAGLTLISLAPRYVGEFEKGIDYKGNVDQLARSLADHAAIARQLGPYKLSLHSGSDKLSMYECFARATAGRFHVKTAGTSYLEALRVAARHDEALFRRIVEFARRHYDVDKATYHVSATVEEVAAPADLNDVRELEEHYLERWPDLDKTGRPDRSGGRGGESGTTSGGFTRPGRQILHCTFGSVLTDGVLGPALLDLLAAEPATHQRILAEHFARHLAALRRGI